MTLVALGCVPKANTNRKWKWKMKNEKKAKEKMSINAYSLYT